jgi:protein involved in ribonucleotide reduction
MYDVVYFSSVSENTKRLVEKLGLTSVRIPLKTDEAASFTYDRDSVLVVPTYGSGEEKTSVPKQVIKFLNNPENRKHIKGVVATGNTNFGESYGLAGDIVSAKLGVPLIQRVELLGTPEDIAQLKERLNTLWELR